jgi:uncharacterized protein Veg
MGWSNNGIRKRRRHNGEKIAEPKPKIFIIYNIKDKGYVKDRAKVTVVCI